AVEGRQRRGALSGSKGPGRHRSRREVRGGKIGSSARRQGRARSRGCSRGPDADLPEQVSALETEAAVFVAEFARIPDASPGILANSAPPIRKLLLPRWERRRQGCPPLALSLSRARASFWVFCRSFAESADTTFRVYLFGTDRLHGR